jgi:hypothetical protein
MDISVSKKCPRGLSLSLDSGALMHFLFHSYTLRVNYRIPSTFLVCPTALTFSKDCADVLQTLRHPSLRPLLTMTVSHVFMNTAGTVASGTVRPGHMRSRISSFCAHTQLPRLLQCYTSSQRSVEANIFAQTFPETQNLELPIPLITGSDQQNSSALTAFSVTRRWMPHILQNFIKSRAL